jgi:putative NADH-flavin reductase
MPSLPSVAIAGATGNVGAKIAAVFLRPEFRDKFQDVIILTRSTTSMMAQQLASSGASLRVYSEQHLAGVLSDVNVLVNA